MPIYPNLEPMFTNDAEHILQKRMKLTEIMELKYYVGTMFTEKVCEGKLPLLKDRIYTNDFKFDY